MRCRKKLRKIEELVLLKIFFRGIMVTVKNGGIIVAISYKKLWKLLIDRDMKKGELQQLANISSSSLAKLGKNENVNTDILLKICTALNCDISDIMEIESSEEL